MAAGNDSLLLKTTNHDITWSVDKVPIHVQRCGILAITQRHKSYVDKYDNGERIQNIGFRSTLFTGKSYKYPYAQSQYMNSVKQYTVATCCSDDLPVSCGGYSGGGFIHDSHLLPVVELFTLTCTASWLPSRLELSAL